MKALAVVDPGPLGVSLAGLLTAIEVLHADLQNLPEPASLDAARYEALGRILDARLPDLYRAYDAHVTQVLITDGKKVTCKRACSACCRHFVSSVEPFELIALDRRLKARPDYQELVLSSHNRTVTYDGILREEGEGEEADDRALYRYFLKGRPCPFVEEDGSCGVYAWRPMACRMFFAESSPRFCAGKALASPWNRNFQVELPQAAEEALARCSRLLASLELPEDLFPGLVAVNGLFGRYEVSSSAPVS